MCAGVHVCWGRQDVCPLMVQDKKRTAMRVMELNVFASLFNSISPNPFQLQNNFKPASGVSISKHVSSHRVYSMYHVLDPNNLYKFCEVLLMIALNLEEGRMP